MISSRLFLFLFAFDSYKCKYCLLFPQKPRFFKCLLCIMNSLVRFISYSLRIDLFSVFCYAYYISTLEVLSIINSIWKGVSMRKLVCIVLTLGLLAALSVSSFAAILAEPCDKCSIGTIRMTDTLYGAWRSYDSDTCGHGDPFHYTDIFERRTETAVYECDNCIYSYEVFLGYEYRTYCNYKGRYYY